MNYDVLSNLRAGLRSNNATTSDGPNLRPTALQGLSNKVNVSAAVQPSTNTTSNASQNSSKNQANPEQELKGKLMSMWNNMKFGWSGVRTRTSFSHEQPVWILGRVYHRKATPAAEVAAVPSMLDFDSTQEGQIPEEPVALPYVNNATLTSPVEELGQDAIEDASPDSLNEDEGLEGFKRDFVSRLWMTYRREFPTMIGSNFTSDCGWGCMIRSGQMLLAEGFVRHFLGRGWRYDSSIPSSPYEEGMHKKIIRWFGDVQSRNSPFSIHNLVALSKSAGKKPGDWYGPGAVAHLLRQAFKNAASDNADLENLNIYVAQDCAVYLQDIFDECNVSAGTRQAPWTHRTQPSPSKQWRSLVLLVPLRLGTERLNQIYGDCLRAMLSLDYCIGIIGGRPKHSLYFVGYQEDKLINLDPHYCQDMVNVLDDDFDVSSFHCKSPRKMKLSKMDPSCCIGFYCKTRAEFERFVSGVQQFLLPCKNWMDKQLEGHSREYCGPDRSYPMFVFCDGRSRDQHSTDFGRAFRSSLHAAAPMSQSAYTTDDDEDGIEEFVII